MGPYIEPGIYGKTALVTSAGQGIGKAIAMINKSDVEIVGNGDCEPVALHAAALDNRFTSVRLINSMEIITEPKVKHQLKNAVPGAIKYYDLPDLINAIFPRLVKIINPVDAYS